MRTAVGATIIYDGKILVVRKRQSGILLEENQGQTNLI